MRGKSKMSNNYTSPFESIEDSIALVKDWTVPVPMSETTVKEIGELITEYTKEVMGKLDEDDAIAAIKEYSSKLKSIYTGHWLRGEYSSLFVKEGAAFNQTVDSESGPIRIQGQQMSNKSATTGASAIIALQNMMGVGRPTKIPLWHSGVVLTVGNFKESEMLSLNHTLNEQRMELGYATQGFLFSGNDVNLVMEVVDFVLDHVIATNVKDWIQGDKATLKELILVSDVPSMLAGSLDSIYPSGYPTEKHCINSGTDKCDYKGGVKMEIGNLEFTPDSLLKFNRTVWVDTNRVSLEAKRHMSSAMGSRSKESILSYQASFNSTDNLSEVLELGEAKLRLSYQQPNLKRYESTGLYWIAGITDMVEKAMKAVNGADNKTRAAKRRDFIKDYEYILRFQKHAPWIKSIQYGLDLESDDVVVVTDIKTIFGLMEEIAQNEKLVNLATESVNEYKTDTQVSFTGIPNFKCPSCGTSQVTGEEAKHGLIPMDMVSYFFTIMAWRLGRIATAQMAL
jgi:hypothetical protein